LYICPNTGMNMYIVRNKWRRVKDSNSLDWRL
jgi:hypothetical protein